MSESLQTITLGGGCFWCTEAVYVKVRGVTDVESGYSNGHVQRPSYEDVCTGGTGHNEVVKLDVRPGADQRCARYCEIFFADPRPDHAEPPGQRWRHPVPQRHLLHHARAEAGGRRVHRAR